MYSSKLIQIIFISISIIIFWNLNGVSAMIFGVSAIFSPLLLILSVLAIFLIRDKLPISLRMGIDLKLFFIFLSSYLFISLLSGLVNLEAIHEKIDWFILIRSIVSIFFIVYAFYLITVYFIFKNNLSSLLFRIGVILLISVVLSAFSDYFGITSVYDTHRARMILDQRVGGLFANPNETGCQALYSLIFMLHLFFKIKHRLIVMGGIVVSIYLSFITFSKSAIIMSIIVIAIYAIWGLLNFSSYTKFGKRRVSQFLGVIIAVAVFLPAYFIANVYANLEGDQLRRFDQTLSLFSEGLNVENSSGRLELGEVGFELITESPIIGNGLGSFHRLKAVELGVHNGYLMVFGESGIFPFLILLICVVLYFKNAFYFPDTEYAILFISLLLVFFIQLILTSHDAFEDRSFNALLGVILGCYKMKNYVRNNRIH